MHNSKIYCQLIVINRSCILAKTQVQYYVESITGIAVKTSCPLDGSLQCTPLDANHRLRVEFVYVSSAPLKEFLGSETWAVNKKTKGEAVDRPSYPNLLIIPAELVTSQLKIMLPTL